MRTVLLVTLFLAVATAARADDRADVIAAENTFAHAMADGDAAKIDRLMSPSYTGSGSKGTVHDKSYWMGSLRSGSVRASKTKIRPLTTRELHVTIAGDNAVVLGDDSETTWLDVWVRRPGGWQILASHRAFKH